MFNPHSCTKTPFEVRIRAPQAGCSSWQWLVAAPGKLLLSGDAGTRDAAVEAARAAANELERLARAA